MNELIRFYRCPETLVGATLPDKLPTFSEFDLPGKLAAESDPFRIVDNLRRERYIDGGHGGNHRILSSEVIRKAYYYFRPMLGISVRKHLQKLFLRNWQELLFPKWPVDKTVEHLLARLLLLSMKARNIQMVPFIWFWPEGASSCVIVTHDVETGVGASFTERVMDVDDSFGIKTSFQIIPEGQYTVSKELLKRICDRGFEVNVQDLNHDGNLFDDRQQFLIRARKINKYLQEYGAQGFRSGRMYRNADWFDALEISYDMSVPNVAHLDPQRGGCCTVFPFFIDNILELPLTTSQDYSLFHVLGEYSIELWKKQIAIINETHGLVSLIIHPDYIMEKRALQVYKSLLEHLSKLRKERNVWVALPRDVNRWWRERSQMRLALEDGRWQIKGPGHQRARIGYACIVDDQIVYTVGHQSEPVHENALWDLCGVPSVMYGDRS